jgi:hypothetical protein
VSAKKKKKKNAIANQVITSVKLMPIWLLMDTQNLGLIILYMVNDNWYDK